MSKEKIICENLIIGYNGQPIVDEINMTIEEGDYFCIVGGNGSGKSTLMKTLLGLIKPISGFLKLNTTSIGYLPQLSEAKKEIPANVEEVVLSGYDKLFLTSEQKENALKVMEEIHILDLRKCRFRELSGGQQQRVLLARALCSSRELLVLDEPIAGLDPKSMEEMYALLKELNKKGATIIMITHDVNVALQYATKTLTIEKGEVKLC